MRFPFAAWSLGPVAVLVATLAPVGARLQSPAPAGTGVLSGRVLDARTSTPIPGTIVTLAGGRLAPERVIVDGQGRFLFTGLPAGAYTVAADKSHYLSGALGRARPDGESRSIDLRDGEHVLDAVMLMWRAATLMGTLTDDVGEPVGGARVLALRRTITAGHWRYVAEPVFGTPDDQGQFRFRSLVPGDYLVATVAYTIAAPAALAAEIDAIRRTGGTAAADFQQLAQRNGAASPILDLFNLMAPMHRVGDTLLATGGVGLMPAAPREGALSLYATTWHASASSPAQATVVHLEAGDDRTGVDLHLTLAPTVRVSGTVVGPDGPVPLLGLRLMPAGLDDIASEAPFFAAITATADDGTFTFVGVHPGPYIIRALTTPAPTSAPAAQVGPTLPFTVGGTRGPAGPAPLLSRGPVRWVASPVTVGDTDLSGVTVSARDGLRITGHVAFEGTSPKLTADQLRGLRVSVDPADGRLITYPAAYRAQVDEDGSFYTIGLPAGRYLVRAGASGPWSLKSALAAGRDISNVPLALESKDVDGLVLTLTDRPASLAGTVHTPASGALEADVLVFPDDPALWTDVGLTPRDLQGAHARTTGAYAFSNLPPGDYDVVAISDESASNWQDPARLRRLAGLATHVHLGDGQHVELGLTLQAVR